MSRAAATQDDYAELMRRVREAHLLQATEDLLSWDQEVMMPAGGLEQRAGQRALMARLAHEALTHPEVGDLLDCCTAESLEQEANLRVLRREHRRHTRMPAQLVAAIADLCSRAQHAWTEARVEDDFARFAPWLQQLVDRMREKADAVGWDPEGEAWDALAEEFEPGMRARDLEPLFAPLRQDLVELLRQVQDSGTQPERVLGNLVLPEAAQENFVRDVAEAMGFDFGRGRLDRATHPFCGGTHPGDVRITTRFRPDELLDALGSTMHEAGHGLYEQGLPAEHAGTPMGRAVSLGIHESQSRLWENLVGRSRGFWKWCAPRLPQWFGERTANIDPQAVFRESNRVSPSLIRVEADETTYNLHVMLRFEIERDLIRGDLTVPDLPERWNQAMRDYLDVEVPNDREGCLQDVHWSCGLFGYFPTYTLGNLYAAQLFRAAERALGDQQDAFARGEFEPLRDWLELNVHRRGMELPAGELCREVTGEDLSSTAFLTELRSRLQDVYGLTERP